MSKLNILKRVLAVVLVLILAMHLSPTKAFAFNPSYMDPAKWSSSQNIASESISKSGLNGDLEGTFSYFVDDEEYCVYVWLNLYNQYITKSTTGYVSFEFCNSKESYSFSVDEYGIADEQEQRYFVANSSFDNKSGYASYIVAIDINNGASENTMKISVNLDGAKYVIAKDVPVIKAEPPTTTKVAKQKTTKHLTTKSTKAKDKKSSKYTTKFRLDTSNASDEYDNYGEIVNAPTQQYTAPNQKKTPKYTTKSRVAIILLSIGAAAGIALIIASAILTKKHPDQEE